MTVKEWPRSVLFVCNQNTVRSPMAKALLDRHTSRRIYCESVGLELGFADPFAAQAINEIPNLKFTDHKPRILSEIDASGFELIVALSPVAHDCIKTLIGSGKASISGDLEYWQIPDPGDGEGNRDQILEAYRLVRDHLQVKIADRFHIS